MKLRHAAALTLVGWYLIMPPMDNHLKPKTAAPLYQWDQIGVPARDSDEPDEPFLTLAECEARKTALKQSHLDESKKNPGDVGKMFLRFSENAAGARCVKGDDPRLRDPMTLELLKEIEGK